MTDVDVPKYACPICGGKIYASFVGQTHYIAEIDPESGLMVRAEVCMLAKKPRGGMLFCSRNHDHDFGPRFSEIVEGIKSEIEITRYLGGESSLEALIDQIEAKNSEPKRPPGTARASRPSDSFVKTMEGLLLDKYPDAEIGIPSFDRYINRYVIKARVPSTDQEITTDGESTWVSKAAGISDKWEAWIFDNWGGEVNFSKAYTETPEAITFSLSISSEDNKILGSMICQVQYTGQMEEEGRPPKIVITPGTCEVEVIMTKPDKSKITFCGNETLDS